MSARPCFSKAGVIAILLSVVLGGCAAKYPITSSAPDSEALITFKDASLRDAETVRTHHLGAFEHVAYARFETKALILEAIYDTSLGDGYALQYDYWMERMIETWNAHRGQSRTWGARTTLRVWYGEMDYQPFRLADGRQCAGFNSSWDFEVRDSFGRPAKVLFGYVCAKPTVKLSEKRLADILSSVSISKRRGESFVPIDGQQQIDRAAFAAAKGQPGTATGNSAFPFNFGTTVEETKAAANGFRRPG
jgi:hypothetical protein